MSDFELSDGIDLEQDLNDAYLRSLAMLGQKRAFSRNEHLYFQGDTAGHVYVLNSGTVKATCTDENGHETLLKIHGPGSLLGLSALRPQALRDANGIALEQAETTCFSRDEFFNYMRSDGELGVLLVRVLLKRQQLLHSRVSDVTGHSVEQRLARVLLQLNAEVATRTPKNEEPVLPITHEELATLVLSRRQYVTAILRTFVSDGLIENKRRRIRILRPEKLNRILSA
ncbi:Crp/Fnr family transcriptional regulator [Pelagibius sp. Alg239-R121]|uniref:Crp/Fnr family transcriptional regulator n=1 Tax=Pelagibius sp. Alg239-R121 TaxID=2993448 RepID=UPI0024A791A4|nr:Crp/Fnr family transcriptional regulator [Pelagibius sp. Alg239-R121]